MRIDRALELLRGALQLADRAAAMAANEGAPDMFVEDIAAKLREAVRELSPAAAAMPADGRSAELLFRYFPDKAELFDALFDRLLPAVPFELIERVFAAEVAADQAEEVERG